MTATIDVALESDINLNFLGPLSDDNTGVYTLRVQKTVYLTAPYVSILLVSDFTTANAWTRLLRVIVDTGTKVDFRPIIGFIRVDLMRNSGDYQLSPLMM